MESALVELRDALNGTDPDRMNTAAEALSVATQKASQGLYEQAAQTASEQGGGDAGGEAPSDDEVVDAEIIEDDK